LNNKRNRDKRDDLKEIVSFIPGKPGVYQFYGSENKIIYIGKAKNLKTRVASYFTNNFVNRKTHMLVKNIVDIKYIVVESEQDAFLLENNLIKKYKPRYNIRLKDDKSYPWICVKNERFPRVFKTRTLIRDGSKYFGPYASVYMVNTFLELFKSEYKLRTCNYNLSKDNIENKKFRVCLEYHIGNCLGPCENLVSEEEYNKGIDEIVNILKGNINGVIRHLQILLKMKSEEMDYEAAQEIKQKYETLMRYQSKSTVVSPTITNVDVFTIEQNVKFAYINYLKIINGAVIQTYTLEISKTLDESAKDLLLAGIIEIRSKIESNAKEILVPFPLENLLKDVNFKVPQKGDKKKLLELSERNARYFKLEKEKRHYKTNFRKKSLIVLEQVQKDLKLNEIPKHIECFDNSNLQGSNPVAACVVFKEGIPDKNEYRHYHIKSVAGPDDYSSMEEVVYRRYRRLLEENAPLPQLIVIDGGKGQLTSAMSAVKKLNLDDRITVISIAKKLEYIYFPGESDAVILDKNSDTIRLIQGLRDEAHRFGISFHRNRRSKSLVTTELANIKGIGEKTIKNLILKFKSVKNIKDIDKEQLKSVVGQSKAKLVYDYFHQNQAHQ